MMAIEPRSSTGEFVVLVCGTRRWDDPLPIMAALSELWAEGEWPQPTKIIHGGARGADSISGMVAQALGYEVEVYPADWATHGRAAGPIRNRQMLDQGPDLVLAFWDGRSPGTKDTIDEATNCGIAVKIVKAKVGAA